MTPSNEHSPDPSFETANPADALPARTTPTWEIEILLSGASAFTLFQVYDGLQESLFDLIQRLSPDMVGVVSALGTYLMAGVMALALGFIAHLAVRAFWAAAVGLHSIDASGSLARTHTLGPVQRALLAERWARMPQRIADLDDWATIVFAVALGLAKMMIGLIVGFLSLYAVAAGLSAATGGALGVTPALMGLVALMFMPYVVASTVDGQRGKKNLPPLPWTARLIAPYAAVGMTPENNLGVQMMVHRLSNGRRSYRGVIATTLLMTVLLVLVVAVPLVDRLGVGTLLRGEFPTLQPGQPHAIRAVHYLDRLPKDGVLRSPAIPSEIARPPYLRLFIPYVAHWHDPLLRTCIDDRGEGADKDWRRDALASAEVLACVAAALPVALDGRPVQTSWVFVEDRRADQRGFAVMIDVRELAAGRHELTVAQPPKALLEDEPVVPWRIPFWR